MMNTDGKRIVFAARKIKYMWIAKLFSIFILLDILITYLLITIALYYVEEDGLGYFSIHNSRVIYKQEDNIVYEAHLRDDTSKKIRLLFENDSDTFTYQIISTDGNDQVIPLNTLIKIINKAVYMILGIELLILLFELFKGVKQIKRKLQYLNEMVETANRLSHITFDEVKVHNLEDAISKISPEGRLHTKDEDFQGLESAINALLERMRETYRQQTRFVSDASHELRTPIAVIQGYVNMLDRWGKQDEKILDESIDAIKNESDHMKKLVEQLLFLARGDSGRNQLNFEKFSLDDMIQEVYEESLMIDENHVYEYHCNEKEISIFADISMIKQTARILVDNAGKYTSGKGTITLRCGEREGNAYFSVTDSGIGMKEEEVVHVFERFYRADTAREKGTGGTGLGLSIAKWIIEKHRGYFEILSREDIGTRITVVLPKTEEAELTDAKVDKEKKS